MMKRSSLFRRLSVLGLVTLAVILGGASTWEGSAIVGGSGDFPGDGLYAACNSFPRNTSVVVTNLETGSSVTVIVTANVDNPGVFIALSPKAAASIGMQQGSASRVRAVASIGSPEAGPVLAQAGQTTDPDFNPGLFMDRDKKAQAAAEGATAGTASSPAPAAKQSPNASAAQFIEEAAGAPAVAAVPPAAALAAASVPGVPAGTAPEVVGGSIPRPAEEGSADVA
ncbi:MAG: hypothetical protein M0Z80_12345, partial [Treponema sp.]|nr:hypothetical protein [Treponema sp.]